MLFTNYTVDILVIDDNSPDGTAEIVDNLSSRVPLYVLKREKKEGLGPAYLAGFTWGLERDYDYFVECDADGSHQPAHAGRSPKRDWQTAAASSRIPHRIFTIRAYKPVSMGRT